MKIPPFLYPVISRVICAELRGLDAETLHPQFFQKKRLLPRSVTAFPFYVNSFLFYPLVRFRCQPRACTLEHLHQKNQQDDRQKHHQIFVTVIAVIDSDLA